MSYSLGYKYDLKMLTIKAKRGTRAQINSAASANGLVQGEIYLITDEDRFAIGLSASTYETYAKESEAGGISYVSPPATPTSTGQVGQRAYDAKYEYICVAENTWKRYAIATNW
jgi:hypothetical protein